MSKRLHVWLGCIPGPRFGIRVALVAVSCVVGGSLLVVPAAAQKSGSAAAAKAGDAGALENHPASKVVLQYLQYALARDWKNATTLITPGSLAAVKESYVDRIKRAPTIDDEMRMVRELGKADLAEVEAMSPAAFYTAYHYSLQRRFNLTEERIKEIASTIKLKVLSVAEEPDDGLAHVLVRTQHQDGENVVRNLELISLTKQGEKWMVTLEAQGPKLTPVPGQEGGGQQ